MLDTIFREYDIRGKVGSELVLDQVYDLARVIAYYFVQQNSAVKTVVVGMDGRSHSPIIQEQVCKALQDSGMNVVFIGLCTSPMLYFALHTLPVDAGLMITASHNPKEYNGIKICLGKTSVWGVQVREIGALFKQRAHLAASVRGTFIEHSILDAYVAWMVEHFPDLIGMQLSAVVDCGNGAGGVVMPDLVKAMQWSNVQLLYAEVDGTYPHHEADPVKEKNMADVKHILQTTDVEVGIGLDGDVDRMAPMTKSGYLVPGDKLLAIFAQQIFKKHPQLAVVMDIKSSAGLIELLEKWGGRAYLSPSGHAIVKDQMKKHDALLGGELSCHFFFDDDYFGYDDGIYAMLRLFQILNQPGVTLDNLLQVFPKKINSPEIHLACPDQEKQHIVEDIRNSFARRSDIAMITIDGVRAVMDYGWGILRASNTQPLLSLRFESDTQQGLERVKEDFFKELQRHFDAQLLREQFAA
jgi:phosphomannomutase/phosphoglucomutase